MTAVSTKRPGVEGASSVAVTLGMLDGRERPGRLGKFSPFDADLTLEVDAPSGKAAVHEIVPAESIAYVAWRRRPGERATDSVAADATRYRVHVAGKRTFSVVLAPADAASAVGFTAFPAQADIRHERFFFYRHGVSAKEKDEPLGEMLVRAGLVELHDLDRAIEQQRSARTTPIGQILVELRKVNRSEVERAATMQQRRTLRIGEVLIEAGLATREDIEAALSEQRLRKGKRLGEILVAMKIVSEETLARTLADKFDIPFVDLAACAINPGAAREVPREVIAKCGVLPVDADSASLTVAIGDPLAFEALDLLRLHTKRRIEEVLVAPSQLAEHVAAFLAAHNEAEGEASFERVLKQLDAGTAESDDEDAADILDAESDSGVVNVVNQLISEAYRRGASDIHVEPNGRENNLLVRFRIDGDCVPYQEIPAKHRSTLVARLKIMARLDIAERRKPQDGKIKFRIGDRAIELRVATIPTSSGGEDVVLRILAASKPVPLDGMRLAARNLRALKELIAKPYGLILCVGPTGSGKTTTLHSALAAINTPDMKIWTAEDPVEITQPGLRQVQVNPRIGFTFAQAMRAFLRADPDVIMIGEMRDLETASTAVEASLTGHLVLSTLHTNSAPETVTRLLDMGLDPFSFGDALLGVLAQRLAKALCAKCKGPREGTRAEYEQLARACGAERLDEVLGIRPGAPFVSWTARGCEACGGTGYKGRVPLHELLVAGDDIHAAIARKAAVEDIRTVARAGGMTTLLEDGVAKALAGVTDLKQVLAVCTR